MRRVCDCKMLGKKHCFSIFFLWLQSIKSFHVYVCKDTIVFSNRVTFLVEKYYFCKTKKSVCR